MAKDSISIRIITPTGLPDGLKNELQVSAFTLNTPEGRIGFLPLHAPIVALVAPGPMFYTSGEQQLRLDLGPGCLELSHDQAELLVESVSQPG